MRKFCIIIFSMICFRAAYASETEIDIDSQLDQGCIKKIVRAIRVDKAGAQRLNEERNKLAKPFVDLYSRYPSYLRQMLCHLRTIKIESDDSMTLAGANEVTDKSGKVIGGFLSVRRSVVEGKDSIAVIQSWREQLNFGANPNAVEVDKSLPVVLSSRTDSSDLLFYLVTHELGHLFDFANRLNFVFVSPHNDLGDDFWTWISWDKEAKTTRPQASFDFPLRTELCFYRCEGKPAIRADQQDTLYSSLQKTNFLTPYSATNPSEDFAESFVNYVLSEEQRLTLLFQTSSGQKYPIVERMRSDPLLEKKRQYIEKFLASKIKYPGEI